MTVYACSRCVRAVCARCLWTGVRRVRNADLDCPQCGSAAVMTAPTGHRPGHPLHWREDR